MTYTMAELKVFESWYDKAGVRATPRRLTPQDRDVLKQFFPKHLIPHLNHPLVEAQEAPLRRYVAAQHLYQWLNFTAEFEVSVVLRATQRIADNKSGLELSRRLRMDAFKICVDENYHALYSMDAVDQLEHRSGIKSLDYEFQPFLARLDGVADAHPSHRQLVQLLQVVVFETLITALLNDVPKDTGVITLVRDIVKDHAIDEGRHHAYFAEFFKHLWGQLTTRERRLVARLLPEIIVESLQPATRSARAALRHAGLSDDAVNTVINESYDRVSVLNGIIHASARTVALFEECGVLDIPEGRDAFARAGFPQGTTH
ncbi:diiron oxygenase [Streptomyces sp. NPDC088760]|uniref:diiron oxygenase n=1 Tax=Streptomyces sp. NPDC088760 TaxID=3365890 RepID=UPI0037F9D39B